MGNFQLSEQADPNELFLTKFSELEGRFDPNYYKPLYKDIENKIQSSNPTDFLCNMADVLNGSTPAKTDYSNKETKYPIIKVGSYKNDFIELSKVAYTNKIRPRLSNAIKDDIYILSSAHQASYVGRFMKYLNVKPKENTTFVGELLCVRGLMNNHKYLFTLLNTNIYQTLINREKRGQTSHIYPKDIRKIKIPIPPKNIQDEIVVKMDKAYQDKKDKETQAQNLLDSIDNYLLSELGIDLPKQTDNSLKARIFTKKFSDIAGSRFDAEYYQDKYIDFENSLIEKGGYIFLKELLQMLENGSRPTGGVGNIASGILSFGGTHVSRDGYIDTSKAKYIPIEYHQKNLATATRINDLLLVKDGATTGKIAIIQKPEHANQNINEHVFLMRLKSNVNPIFLLSYLKSSFGNIQIKREITGATVTGLTKNVVNALKIPLPPLEKQNQIAEHISKIRNQAKQLQLEAKTGLEQAKQAVENIILEE